MRGRFSCALCGEVVRHAECFVVNVDAFQNAKQEVKANTHLACSDSCAEQLRQACMVEFAFLGIVPAVLR